MILCKLSWIEIFIFTLIYLTSHELSFSVVLLTAYQEVEDLPVISMTSVPFSVVLAGLSVDQGIT